MLINECDSANSGQLSFGPHRLSLQHFRNALIVLHREISHLSHFLLAYLLGKFLVFLSRCFLQDLFLQGFVLQRLGFDRVSVLFLYVHLTSLKHKKQVSSPTYHFAHVQNRPQSEREMIFLRSGLVPNVNVLPNL